MPFLRRLTAACVAALLLQLSLLGSGTLCALQGGAATDTMAGTTAARGGDHASAPTAPASAPSHSQSHDPAAPQRCDGSTEGGGCGQPWAPGQCVSMTACAAVTAPAGVLFALVAFSSGTPDLPEPASIASGPAAAPELPPPRA